MGWNTTVVFNNDSLEALKTDPDVGKKIHAAISGAITIPDTGKTINIPAIHHTEKGGRMFCSVGTVVETHHADAFAVVAVGNNDGVNLGTVYPYGTEPFAVRVLKALADQLGFEVHKKRTRKAKKS